jgi:hypothetical protein
VYNLNYTPTALGVQSWREIKAGGMRKKRGLFTTGLGERIEGRQRKKILAFIWAVLQREGKWLGDEWSDGILCFHVTDMFGVFIFVWKYLPLCRRSLHPGLVVWKPLDPLTELGPIQINTNCFLSTHKNFVLRLGETLVSHVVTRVIQRLWLVLPVVPVERN